MRLSASLRRALMLGRETRTPAVQADLVDPGLTFRDVFTEVAALFSFVLVLLGVRCRRQGLVPGTAAA